MRSCAPIIRPDGGEYMTAKTRARLLASSFICGAALSSLSLTPASAQSIPNGAPAPTQEAPAGEVAEIIVTGTRIANTNLTSTSPVQAVAAQEFQLQGRPNTIEVLNTLPQLNQIGRSEEHTSELQSRENLVCRLLLEKKK